MQTCASKAFNGYATGQTRSACSMFSCGEPMYTLEELRIRAARGLIHQPSSMREAWVHQAEPWLEITASALEALIFYGVGPTTQPATTLDVFDATRKRLWAPEVRPENASKDQGDVTPPWPIELSVQQLFTTEGEKERIERVGRNTNGKTIWGVADAARALRSGEISVLELLDESLAKIDASEKNVKAWECVIRDAARAAAQELMDSPPIREEQGLLFGIPFGAKDNVNTRGVPTTGSSEVYEHFVPSSNADIIETLDLHSAILVGKTTATEMALGDPPPTRNPWNLNHTPGGSSAGSAAAVAADHVPFAVASQTGGSINRPASYCGLVAVKPTWGRISRRGVLPLAWTLDHLGVMTRNVEDQAWVLDGLCGTSYRHLVDRSADARRTPASHAGSRAKSTNALRIGRPDRYFFGKSLHPAQHQAYEAMLKQLQHAGMTIVDFELPPTFEVAVHAHTIIMQCEVATAYALGRPENIELMRPTLRSRIIAGLATPAPMYLRAQQVRREYIKQLQWAFEHIDILATPSTPTPADKGIEYSGSAAFNSPFSMAGLPTIVFPTGVDGKTGCPLSAQLVARPNHEEHLFKAAFAYEQRTEGNALSHVYAG